MSNEYTKRCVAVLKAENEVKYILAYPFVKFFKFCELAVNSINWCIARAVGRWVSPVILVCFIYYMWAVMHVLPVNSTDSLNMFMVSAIIIVSISTVMLVCWSDLPKVEREIITEYKKRLEIPE